MLLSFNWLKQHVNLPDSVTAKEVGEKLKLATVEVEEVRDLSTSLENVVVGKVVKITKHQNADKLQVCEVDSGKEKVTVVCGGSNVKVDMLCALGKVGAKVKWHGVGELVELKPTKIRGVASNGMICASDEIGLGEMFPKKDDREIVDLSIILNSSKGGEGSLPNPKRSFASAQDDSISDDIVGKPLAEALNLNDTVLEIDNKSLSHRPDLWGHYGMAREVAVLFNRDVKKYAVPGIDQGRELKIKADVKVPKSCHRYMAVAMSNIKVEPSPAWLQNYLVAVGVRPINNIVDITNYVMLDIGQPTHAFDLKKLDQPKKNTLNIVVRAAKHKEKFTTLDGEKRELDSNMFLITDGVKGIALGGLMGGENTEITGNTTGIMFESANFDATVVRKTSDQLSLRTEGSARWEKAQDSTNAEIGLKKLVELTTKLCPGAKVISNVAEVSNFKLSVGQIQVPLNFFEQKLGVNIPAKKIITTLEFLGFGVKKKKDILLISVPSWRATKDIVIEEDIVEEVARVYGFDNIPVALPAFTVTPPAKNTLRFLERRATNSLVQELGFTEVYNYSFVSAGQVEKIGDSVEDYIELNNPLSKEKPYLRRHLLLNLIENIKNNSADYSSLKLLEVGKVYRREKSGLRAEPNSDELLPEQNTYLAAVVMQKGNKVPFWSARQAIETLGSSLSVDLSIGEKKNKYSYQHPGRCAQISLKGECVGSVYELHPLIGNNFGLKDRLGVAQLNLSKLSELIGKDNIASQYSPISAYPWVKRDVALLVKKQVTHAEISKALIKADSLIKQVEIFDVYEGKNIGEDYKSMAYRLTYSDPNRTLTSKEVDATQTKVEELLKRKFKAEVR